MTGSEYRLAIDAFSGEITHVIERDRLVLTYAKTARTESVPFASIREINLRQEMAGIYSAIVKRDGGRTLRITSRHFRGIGQFDDRRGEYGAFVRSLTRAVADSGSPARFTIGSSLLFGLGWLLVLMTIAFVAILVFGLATGHTMPPLRVLFVLPIGVIVGGGFVRQGRARSFDPSHPPEEFAPVGAAS